MHVCFTADWQQEVDVTVTAFSRRVMRWCCYGMLWRRWLLLQLQNIIKTTNHKVVGEYRRTMWTGSMILKPTINALLTSNSLTTAVGNSQWRHHVPAYHTLKCLLHVLHELCELLNVFYSLCNFVQLVVFWDVVSHAWLLSSIRTSEVNAGHLQICALTCQLVVKTPVGDIGMHGVGVYYVQLHVPTWPQHVLKLEVAASWKLKSWNAISGYHRISNNSYTLLRNSDTPLFQWKMLIFVL